ncbi:MAG: restriction endonuclease [Solirubrobacterales bacterium]
MALFDDLSDYDFELLVADLLGAKFKRTFETFSRGRDGGIDIRARLSNGLHVVQCKHYANSAFSTLERAARREQKTLSQMQPKPRRYMFVTSRRLTANNKAKLFSALAPYVRHEQDILGAEDLAALLRRYPSVERGHVKLWLRGSGTLDRIVNADVLTRSTALLADIRTALPRYVQTNSFNEAHDLLARHNVVIIAGPPGVGKTTLAHLLLLDAVQAGYTPYRVQADVAEAWRLYKDEEPQVFFFDDFLGRTALFDSVRGDPRDLASFIRHVRRSNSTRLVLATREYVLQKARFEIEDLQWQRLEAEKYALTLARYSRLDRARIFYNHIFFSPEVDSAAIADLLAERAYLDVISHPAYSPRLIEWMTGLGGHLLTFRERAQYSRFCISVLDDPESLWRHAYSRGLGDAERCVLLALPGLPAVVPISDLESSYAAAARCRALSPSRSAFEAALKVLQDSFVRVIDWGRGRLYVSAVNPSLIDFLKTQLASMPGELVLTLAASTYFEQVTLLRGVAVEMGLPEHEWAKGLAAAVGRTLEADAPGADPRENGWRRREPEHFSDRLERVVEWCHDAPVFAEHLAPLISSFLSSKREEIFDGGSQTMVYWPRLLVALGNAGFDVTEQLTSMKRRVLDKGETFAGFEAFRELQKVEPTLFTIAESAAMKDRFAGWADGCLDEATGYFEDMEEFERFEDLAVAFGIELADEAVDIAREEIHEVQAEREAEARLEIDADQDEEDRSGGGRPSFGDWEQIDSMFGTLGGE